MTIHGGAVFKNVEIRAGMEKVGEASNDIININTLCGVFEEFIECGKNMKNSASGDSYSEIIEKYADDHEFWAKEFLEGWDKMLCNGYTSEQLFDAPQTSWLGYNSWTKGGV